ncbi:MAG: Flp family type IVb pilin [Eubacteriales bacterium]
MKNLKAILKDESGQGMVEYGLILGLIAIAAVVALVALGPKISNMFNNANNALP